MFKKGEYLILHDPVSRSLGARDWEVKVIDLGTNENGEAWYDVVPADKSIIQMPRRIPEKRLERIK